MRTIIHTFVRSLASVHWTWWPEMECCCWSLLGQIANKWWSRELTIRPTPRIAFWWGLMKIAFRIGGGAGRVEVWTVGGVSVLPLAAVGTADVGGVVEVMVQRSARSLTRRLLITVSFEWLMSRVETTLERVIACSRMINWWILRNPWYSTYFRSGIWIHTEAWFGRWALSSVQDLVEF